MRWFRHNKGRFVFLMFLVGVVIAVGLPLLGLELGLALALALGFPSFIYGSVQFADASDTIGKLLELEEALRSDTRRLEHQLSTRQLGPAPDFIAQIVEMVSGARRRVTICCDFPAYGAVTDRDEYTRYLNALQNLKGDVEVELLHLDENARRGIARDFYISDGSKAVTKRFADEAEFQRLVAKENEQALEEQFQGANTFETSFIMPLFFWIVDDDAVFSLRRLTKTGEDDVEVGFKTRDPTLVSSLRDIFTRYTQISAQYELVTKRPTAMAEPGRTG